MQATCGTRTQPRLLPAPEEAYKLSALFAKPKLKLFYVCVCVYMRDDNWQWQQQLVWHAAYTQCGKKKNEKLKLFITLPELLAASNIYVKFHFD